jgi:CPA1 family monovalent cation:H+ antiporter
MPRDFDPSQARVGIVSSSVWQVLVFTFNGVVFVMLGTQLPNSFGNIWIDDGISNWHLIMYVLAITLLMHGTRFIWTLGSDAWAFREQGLQVKVSERLRSAALMTFAGSKGAITLAIMFSLPVSVLTENGITGFPYRDLLIFLASGVILLSLLLATFLVPRLAPRAADPSIARERDAEGRAQVLRSVIEELTARLTPENRHALAPVIAQYTERLERFKEMKDLEDDSDLELRIKVLEWEQEFVLDEIDRDEVPPLEGYQYINRLARTESMLKRGKNLRLSIVRWCRSFAITVRKFVQGLMGRLPGAFETESARASSKRIRRELQVRSSIYVCDRLRREMAESDVQSEKTSQLIAEYERTIALLRGPAPSITTLTKKAEPDLEIMKLALRIELEQIQLAYDEGRLTWTAAQRMRENVYLMQIDLTDNV